MMRNLFLIFITTSIIMSCSENNRSCIETDWLGTYSGVKTCQGTSIEEYEFNVMRIELPVDPAPDNFLLIDDQLFKFQDCQIAKGILGGEFISIGSLENGLLIIETDSCRWEANKR